MARGQAARAVIDDLLRPVRALQWHYLPLLMVYFAYGATGLIDVSRDLWVKEALSLTPAELAGIGVWLTLPWTVKMVFGELVDSVPILGSQRRAYIVLGALCTACGLVLLAGGAGGWLTFRGEAGMYVAGSLLLVLGAVIQDVVADAISTEVVARETADGTPRDAAAVKAELGMVQVLGRLALGFGILSVAGLSGWLAEVLDRESVFLVALVVPALSLIGAVAARDTGKPRAPDWRILGGGLAFGTVVVAIGVGGVPFAEEIVFTLSMAVICTMLAIVTRGLAPATRRAIFFTIVIIFAFRATPTSGDGYFWFTLDVLGFDPAFYGVLRQTAAVLGVVVLWVFARQITQYSVTSVLFWLAIASSVLALPNVGLVYGLHEWTQAQFGFGARTLAIIDAATASPFVQLSMVPLLTLTAFYAPAGHRATWFALMASLMNLALVAGQLQTKVLNEIFTVGRGDYAELGSLALSALVIGFVVPVGAILLLRHRVEPRKEGHDAEQ